METSWSVKASTLAIIILVIVSAFWHPAIAKAQSLKSLKNTFILMQTKKMNETPENLEKLEIKPRNKVLHSNGETLKIEIDVKQLAQIKKARKKALELERKKAEEAKKQAEAKAKAEAKKQADAKVAELTKESLSYDELVNKLNRSLNSTLKGQGEKFAKYAIELGIDPYLAVAIVLHETGCKWNCSSLLKQCNNVGGMKGSPGCNGGSYKAFSSLDEGISAFMNNLYKNYYAKGLTTPETIGPKYAASSTWASKIRAYMQEIEAN